jgi:hypothetical protein
MHCPANTMTVCRELRRVGFHGRAAAYKSNISPVHAKHLLKWCKERCHWTVDTWKRVIWDDESHYTMWQSNGRIWVWQMPGEQCLPACVVPTVKFGGGCITVWGCFSWDVLGPLVILRGNLDTEGYKDILTRCILSMVEVQFRDSCLYRHVSASCHKARSVRKCFLDNMIPEMDWPAQRPEQNPIEYLWDELECRPHPRPQHPTSLTAQAAAL